MKFRASKPMHINAKNGRWGEMKQQIKERGFADSELWSLDYTIASFVLPRLKQFRKKLCSHPGYLTAEEWDIVLGKMIFSFEQCVKEEIPLDAPDKFEEGIQLFGQYFRYLWD